MEIKGFDLTPKAKKVDLNYYKTYAWKKLRLEHLKMEPLCRMCDENNRVILANTVDHIQPRRRGGADAHYNLQSLCQSCHDKKRAVESQDEYNPGKFGI